MKEKKLLVIIDVINGFIKKGNLADKNIERIVPNIINLLKKANEKNDYVIAFKDTHAENDKEFLNFPPHCIKGTEECEIINELKPYIKNNALEIEKDTTNGFNTLMFRKIIKNMQFEAVEVCGCCSDICVYNFVESLNNYFVQNSINTKIEVYANAIDTFNGKDHNADLVNAKFLAKMQNMEKVKVKKNEKGVTNEKIY